MKTKLLRRLRKEARENTPSPAYHIYSSLYEALIVIIHYEDEKRNYILRRVSELKQKRK
mgnify:CR=1 FL=1|jgi:hypothetical protein